MEEQHNDYGSKVETLLSMFGEVLCKDAIVSIVESCGGDLQDAANIIMNITNEDEALNQKQDNENNVNTPTESNKLTETMSNTNSVNIQAQETTSGDITSQPGTIVYSQAILKAPSPGAIPKQIPKKHPEMKQESKEIEDILKLHADGIRTLILMRGASGSGKTHLAKSIINKIYNCFVPGYWSLHIFSADDYFLRGGVYCYDRTRLPEAHQWNQKRSYVAMSQGLSPVIIDNTNIEVWQMEPYVREGVKNGYVLILLEPKTPWAKKIGQLLKRNIHNVPPHSLERMLNNFQRVTSESLLDVLGLSHNINRTLNIRTIPEFIPKISSAIKPELPSSNAVKPELQSSNAVIPELQSSSVFKPEPQSSSAVIPEPQTSSAGIPELQSSNAVIPELQSSSAFKPEPQSSSVFKPEPQISSAVIPEPQTSSAGIPELQSSNAVIPELQSSSAFKPEPQSSSAVIPEPQTSSAGIPELQSSSAYIKQENERIIEKQMQNNLQFGNNLSNFISLNEQKGVANTNKTAPKITASTTTTSGVESLENLAVYKEVEKHLEEAAKIENEWDNGENWDDSIASKQFRKTKQQVMGETKQLPQRIVRPEKYSPSEKLLSAMENVQDWTMFMPTWSEASTSKAEQSSAPPIEKSTTGTSMEIGDTVLSNSKNPFKVVTATPRDINEFFINEGSLKIPEKWMLDKSTSTNNEAMHTPRCKNEEKHFIEFRKLFKYISRADLRDIFDKCHGDVNWAVDIVFSDIGQMQSDIQDEVLLESDNDDENCENYECDCVAAYNVIPDQNTTEEIKPVLPTVPATTSSPLPVKRKIKKDNNKLDAFSQLKQKIEQNIVISDDHYSKHCLKIRKFRRGEREETEETVKITESNLEVDSMNKEILLSSSNTPDNDINKQGVPDTTNNSDESDDETISTVDEVEKTISIDVTKDLMSQLDMHFGWKEMVYSSNISTKINVPISILNELNAIWIESLLFQMEENSKQLEIMVKQDEEFARQMAQKEAELLQTTDEPGIPDFKEIMDLDYALSLYHKDVAQWRNNEPSDLAAKLSRDKLKKLFPDLSEDSLSEILMAHDNNFKMTVEALLVSTGKSEVMLAHNGVSKFIIDSENEQREKLLKKENKTLSDSERPPLPENEEINMDLVRKYREEAEKHLKFRNMSHQKAQELMRRGMTPAATFYSEIAAYHKMKYEQSNSYAAASLIHLHAHSGNEGDTVDLHFLHVNEAKESLDLFLDEHIQILRNKTDQKYQKLFFITGRGLHSNGRPKIKPAVKKRLRERGLHYSETNPGLLSAKVSATNVLANELG